MAGDDLMFVSDVSFFVEHVLEDFSSSDRLETPSYYVETCKSIYGVVIFFDVLIVEQRNSSTMFGF